MQLKIDNRVIKHLGKDLITSSDVAVVELVKNSMDANASNITLQLYDDFTDAPELDNRVINKLIPHTFLQCPLLIVSDDGKGMTDDELKSFLKRCESKCCCAEKVRILRKTRKALLDTIHEKQALLDRLDNLIWKLEH